MAKSVCCQICGLYEISYMLNMSNVVCYISLNINRIYTLPLLVFDKIWIQIVLSKYSTSAITATFLRPLCHCNTFPWLLIGVIYNCGLIPTISPTSSTDMTSFCKVKDIVVMIFSVNSISSDFHLTIDKRGISTSAATCPFLWISISLKATLHWLLLRWVHLSEIVANKVFVFLFGIQFILKHVFIILPIQGKNYFTYTILMSLDNSFFRLFRDSISSFLWVILCVILDDSRCYFSSISFKSLILFLSCSIL